MFVTFEDWTQHRALRSFGTNAGASELPFQSWRHFKEAFAPELVARAVLASEIPVKRCLDPFGGSGTTALACQFLGAHPVTVEVNPFLADLIQAKLTQYDADALAYDFGLLVRRARQSRGQPEVVFRHVPTTFIEPGSKGRWIFDRLVAARIAAWLQAITGVSNTSHRRLFKVLLGGVLVEVSNVIVSGKGRRYRQRWEQRRRDPLLVDQLFSDAVRQAIGDIHLHAKRACSTYEVHCGDCRRVLTQKAPCDLAVFSPPYPNSFDYTDVYNLELWTLGYLTNNESNRLLRQSTFSSHVQIGRTFPPPPLGSAKLKTVLQRLESKRPELWNHRIPAMVGGYFSDLMSVLRCIRRSLACRGSLWMVVGDSCYADVRIHTAGIITELAPSAGWRLETIEDCRSMRASPQQGGRPELAETLIVLKDANCLPS